MHFSIIIDCLRALIVLRFISRHSHTHSRTHKRTDHNNKWSSDREGIYKKNLHLTHSFQPKSQSPRVVATELAGNCRNWRSRAGVFAVCVGGVA